MACDVSVSLIAKGIANGGETDPTPTRVFWQKRLQVAENKRRERKKRPKRLQEDERNGFAAWSCSREARTRGWKARGWDRKSYPTPPGNAERYQSKGVARQESGGQAGKAIRKSVKTKGGQKRDR
jgi:hypothetical protein